MGSQCGVTGQDCRRREFRGGNDPEKDEVTSPPSIELILPLKGEKVEELFKMADSAMRSRKIRNRSRRKYIFLKTEGACGIPRSIETRQ